MINKGNLEIIILKQMHNVNPAVPKENLPEQVLFFQLLLEISLKIRQICAILRGFLLVVII